MRLWTRLYGILRDGKFKYQLERMWRDSPYIPKISEIFYTVANAFRIPVK